MGQELATRNERWAAKLRVAADRLAHDERTRSVPFTRERRRKYLAAVAAGVTVTDAALYAGVSHSTAWEARKRDPSFAEEFERAFEASCGAVEARIEDIALDGDASSMATVRAAELFLSGRSSRYRKQAPGTTTATVKSGPDGGSLTVRIGTPVPE